MARTVTGINIENLNPAKKIDRKEVKRVAARTARRVGAPVAAVNIIFVTDSEIRLLNRKYLGHDRVTDVLAFPWKGSGCEPGWEAHEGFLGDIAISSDTAALNAEVYKVAFKEEILRYVAHGMLHLLGFKDHTVKDKTIMREMENGIIRRQCKKVRK